MGKMKELYMKIQYQSEYDLEREYLINDILAKEHEYDDTLELSQEIMNQPLTTKIEVSDGSKTRIEVNQEKQSDNIQTKGT